MVELLSAKSVSRVPMQLPPPLHDVEVEPSVAELTSIMPVKPSKTISDEKMTDLYFGVFRWVVALQFDYRSNYCGI